MGITLDEELRKQTEREEQERQAGERGIRGEPVSPETHPFLYEPTGRRFKTQRGLARHKNAQEKKNKRPRKPRETPSSRHSFDAGSFLRLLYPGGVIPTDPTILEETASLLDTARSLHDIVQTTQEVNKTRSAR